jgi:hypothetical protein
MIRDLLDAPSDEDQVPWHQAGTSTDALDEAPALRAQVSPSPRDLPNYGTELQS